MIENKDPRRICGDKIKGYSVSVIVIAAIAALLRVVALIFDYDYILGYYNSGFLVTFMTVICLLGCVWGFSALFLLPRSSLMASAKPASNMIALYFCAFIFLADAIYALVGMFSDVSAFFSVFDSVYDEMTGIRTERILAVSTILGVIASLAMSACLFKRALGKSATLLDITLGFFPIIRLIVGVFAVYFDMQVPMNSPHKTIIEWALIASMFFFLYENRFFASVEKRPRAYLAFGFISMILTLSAGVGGIFAYFSGLFLPGRFCIESFLCLTLFVHITASVLSYGKQVYLAADGEDIEDSEKNDDVDYDREYPTEE